MMLVYSPSSTVLGTVITVSHGGFAGTVHRYVSSLMSNFSFTVSGEAVKLKPSHERSSESGT